MSNILATNGIFNVIAFKDGINGYLQLDDGLSYFIQYDDDTPYIIVNGAVIYLNEFIMV